MKKIVLFFGVLIMAVMFAASASAQSVWASAGLKAGLAKGLAATAEGEYRTHDGMERTERFSGAAGLEYKALPFLKFNAAYTFIYQQSEPQWESEPESLQAASGAMTAAFWQPKHRFSVAATGSVDWGSMTFSLRERYQMTYSSRSDSYKNVLRSRIMAEYEIAETGLTPFVSAEMYSYLKGLSYDKTKVTAGVGYQIDSHNSVELYYRYIDHKDDDEDNGHVIGVGYSFSF